MAYKEGYPKECTCGTELKSPYAEKHHTCPPPKPRHYGAPQRLIPGQAEDVEPHNGHTLR